jgi:hypothetical protein
MSDLDLRSRLESAVRPAYTSTVDTEADLARGRRSRRRRRAYQLAAGTSACAVASAAAAAGLPALGDGGDAGPSGDRSVTVATGDPDTWRLELPVRQFAPAVRAHLGLELNEQETSYAEDDKLHFTGYVILHDGESFATLSIRDDVRVDRAPVPLRCAGDDAYDVCHRRTLPDGTEVAVGRGDDDLLATAWSRDGDLVEVSAHWPAGSEHDLTLDQLIDLATDDRIHLQPDPVFDVRPMD